MKRGFTILLAEDDGNDVVLFKHAVEESAEASRVSIKVQVVGDGAEAISYLDGEGAFSDRNVHPFPDLIVLDLRMAGLGGLEVLRWLKEHPEYRRVPKVLLSGSSEDRDIEAADQLGGNTYFQKPGALGDYRELIHHLIGYWAHTKRPVIRDATFRFLRERR
jgi:two-component system response regulator